MVVKLVLFINTNTDNSESEHYSCLKYVIRNRSELCNLQTTKNN